MRIITGLIAASACCLFTAGVAVASPYSISPYSITFTGLVENSHDPQGFFGVQPNATGTQDDGLAYVETFYITPSLGTVSEDAHSLDIDGGSEFKPGVNPISSTLFIGGYGTSFAGSYVSHLSIVDLGGLADIEVDTEAFDTGPLDYINAGIQGDFSPPTAPGAPFSFVVDGSKIYNVGTGFAIAGFGISGTLVAQHVTSGVIVSPTPEPGAWALMETGVGLVGGMLRLGRRRGWEMAAV